MICKILVESKEDDDFTYLAAKTLPLFFDNIGIGQTL